MHGPENVKNKHTPLKHGCSSLTAWLWVKATQSSQMSQLLFYQHGICYIAADLTLLSVRLITFLLQHMQTHPLEDKQ